MNKQKGISQIVVMIIMLVLAIALPVTTRLVQKSQENRSKATAAGTKVYGQRCTSNAECISNFCTLVGTAGHSFEPNTAVCSKPDSDDACSAMSGTCSASWSAANWSSCGTSKYVIYNLCESSATRTTARCCVPMPRVGEQCGNSGFAGTCIDASANNVDGAVCSVNGGTNNGTLAFGLCGGASNIRCCIPDPVVCTAGAKQCSGTKLQTCTNNAWVDTTDCGALGCNSTTKACNAAVCTAGAKQCSGTKLQTCTNNAWVDSETCAYGCSGGVCNNPTCDVGEKQCLSNVLQKCNSTRTGWETDQTCDATYGCNSTSKTCNVCVNGNQKCSTSDNYFTCDDGQWSTSTTDCTGDKVCTNGANSASVCHDPEYVAPTLNMQIALLGVGVVGTTPKCLGDIKLKINVSKVGQPGITREITATKVDSKFSTIKTAGDGYQVYQVSNFALDNTFALVDKIYINIAGANSSSNLKLLTTLYGKNNQTSGFVPQDESQVLVSSLVNSTLNLYNYPILNGDIGSQTASTQGDGVVNGFDFVHMKNQWGKSVAAGETLRSDLNGDCFVDSIDLQIYKNSTSEQYTAKTF